jgi:hypothetical protein
MYKRTLFVKHFKCFQDFFSGVDVVHGLPNRERERESENWALKTTNDLSKKEIASIINNFKPLSAIWTL